MSVPASAEPQGQSQGQDPGAPSTGQAGVAQAQEQRADPTQVSGAGTQEQATRTPDYVRDAFARLRGYTQQASASAAPTAPSPAPELASQTPPASSPPAQEAGRSATQSTGPATTFPAAPPSQQRSRQGSQAPPPGGGSQVVLSQEEYQRRIQSEADRILAKQRRDDETRAAQEQERELRRTNPFEYARMMESKEQELEASRAETQRLTGIVGTQLQYYDRAVLDTFVGALPEDERTRVIAPDGDGIENRKATAANTLKALRSRWVAEGRASARDALMKDQTFIKEILARYGQAAPEAPMTPAYARPSPGGNGSGQSDENARMGAFIRAGASAVRT